MDIMYLREFVDLFETCNFQETAANMNISTSSLSKHIGKLEADCGVPLFDRTTRTVKTNEYGSVFVEYARQIINLEEQGITALSTLHRENAGSLKIGFMPVMVDYGITEMLLDFIERYPDIAVEMLSKDRITELFGSDKCNFVFYDECNLNDLSLSSFLCKEDRLVVVLPSNHPLSQEQQITVEQLRGEKLILHGRSQQDLCRDSQSFCKFCRDAGYTPNIYLTSSNTSTIMKLVRKGVGIAVLNQLQCPAQLLAGITIRDLSPAVPFHIYCLYPKGRRLSSSGRIFLNFVKDYLQKWPNHAHDAATPGPRNG